MRLLKPFLVGAFFCNVRHKVLIYEALDNSRLQIKLIVWHKVLIYEEEDAQ
jgi:hypothetical protein